MMGLDNPIHIAFVLVLLLLIFGAKRLPEMGQSLGAGLRGFKESLTGETHVSQLSSGPTATPADGLTAHHADAEPESERSPVRPAA